MSERIEARVTPSFTTPDGNCLRCGVELKGEFDGDQWCEACFYALATDSRESRERTYREWDAEWNGDAHPASDREGTEE